jgi:membrane associated rhomboid family serine protease
MVDASVGFQCPECVRTGSGTGHRPDASLPRTIAGGAVAADPRLLTKIIIAVNIVMFGLALGLEDQFVNRFTMIGLAYDPSITEVVGVADGEWYRLATAMFLHEQTWHIFFNMLLLWWLGGPLEEALGRVRFLALYLISGLAGSALTYLLEEPAQGSLGASGAIYGLLGATVVLMRRLRYDLRPIVVLIGINLVITFFWEGIAWQAHIGGLVAGAVMAYGLVHAPQGRRRNTVQFATCAFVLLAVVGTILARTASIT